MDRVRVKICGVMRAEDARAASGLGADAVGMIFHAPSRRNVSLERAGEIADACGTWVTRVGVFVDAPLERILEVRQAVGLDVVQLHGAEPLEVGEALARARVRFVKALKVGANLAREVARWRMVRGLGGIVLETGTTPLPGGSGVENDWEAVREAKAAGVFDGLELFAAGGVRVDNVRRVIELVRPTGVDVSSGVESVLGEKSAQQIRALVAAVTGA